MPLKRNTNVYVIGYGQRVHDGTSDVRGLQTLKILIIKPQDSLIFPWSIHYFLAKYEPYIATNYTKEYIDVPLSSEIIHV